ncbi:MAG TPA: tRNA (adenosine(37)-N6)-threonylcarbamoyltransferase complex ATPase subunit type 1 TsaE [Ruminiclostridium sp.]|jgi:tRNA threonylcarbamoyladenosine biosynthesis protein TsaE|nr:tRNA (adenosine(37)-N6)-threonylcarbamoyltransferase complex ATPase subunit type 1 TsaE [Clostridiaceae bacterium]HAA25925.1 tRNA (adenosine(37)-N6)-threonylcarbamoyltransferase complex ATPase subunit type 1 TsaE [Ruminiclostridium sp.]
MQKFITYNENDTIELGEKTAGQMKPGDIIALEGELGTGKTVFVKGVAKGLNIREHVTSPTFNIVHSYEDGSITLHHFDVYRVSDEDELFEIGFEEYLYKGDICIIEWADLIKNMLPENTVWIKIERTDNNPDQRIITIRGLGPI